MDQSSDAMNLAMAIHLTQCQRTLNLRHAELRKLTDQCPDLAQLIQLDLEGLIGLLTAKDDNREETLANDHGRIESQALAIHQALQNPSSQRSAIALARQCDHLAIKPVLSGDPQFPKALHELNTCPALLYVRGSLLPDMLRCFPWVTVIGTRRPTVYGQKVTRKITRGLCQGGAVIVSGLARGIDTLAHQTALKNQGFTVGVIASGHDYDYPPENAELIAEMAERGVILSEHPPGVPPVRQNFPARNRLLSGLSKAVAVMEAAQKSGTLITTTYAADQNRDVFAVPGSILDQASAGCHQLIRDGAHVLESVDDIFQICGLERQLSWLEPSRQRENGVQDGAVSRILQALRIHSLTMDELTAEIPDQAQETMARVALLELQGYLVQSRGRYALTELGDSSI